MSILNQALSFVLYDDADSTNNPNQRYSDWKRNILASISNPQSKKYVILPNSVSTIFSGVRATAIDNTSAFSIDLNAYNGAVYRITSTAGTAPAFRTDRGLTLGGQTVTVAINNNATATFTIGGGSLAAVQTGDSVFVPSTLTGDAALTSPFSLVNGGLWVVLAKTTTVLTLMRPIGQPFSAVAESVTLTSNAQLQAFSAAGIQVNDTLEISSGFNVITQRAFRILNVNSAWVEFTSTDPLPLEIGILPTAGGMTFYTDAKRWVRIETDQNAVARFNGDTGNTNRIDARTSGDLRSGFGFQEKWGTAWSLDIVNLSRTSPMTIIVFSGE